MSEERERDTLYRLHTVIMQDIKDYHFAGAYDFQMRVRYEDNEFKFRYLNEWHPVSQQTLHDMVVQSKLSPKLYQKLKFKLVAV